MLTNILENLTESVIAAGADGKVKYVNTSALGMLETTGQKIIGKQVRDFVKITDEMTGQPFDVPFEKVLSSDRAMRNMNHSILHTGKGRKLHINFDLSPINDEDENERCVLMIIRDSSESKKAELDAEEKFRNINRELEQFVYIASHDLQEPLRMVASYVQLLEKRYKGKLDGDADEFIFYTVDGVNRMKNILNDLLGYSRLNTRKEAAIEVDCNELVGKITDNFTSKPDAKVAFEITPLPVVNCVASQFIQLFYHLIDNAIKFSDPENCVVKISAEKSGDGWQFNVEDKGIGIEKKYSEKIFSIFQRLHGSSEYPGTGVGLAICRKIVELHGGEIWFDSEPGNGTTFHFTVNSGVKEA